MQGLFPVKDSAMQQTGELRLKVTVKDAPEVNVGHTGSLQITVVQ
jgi:hypothetical protein